MATGVAMRRNAEVANVEPPPTLRGAFRAECRRTFRPPFVAPITVAANGILMITAWFLLPRSWLFHYTNTPAFPLALASWMYSDVIATNVLGADASRAAQALDDPVAFGDMLRAKTLVLWLLVAPVCTVITLSLDFDDDRWFFAVATTVAVAVVPLGGLGFASWVGVRYPYHPRPLRWRWDQRGYRDTLRWLILLGVPYAVVPGVTLLITAPSLWLWTVTAPDHDTFHPATGWLCAGVALACVLAAAGWRYGHRGAVAWAMRRRPALVSYLADPEQG